MCYKRDRRSFLVCSAAILSWLSFSFWTPDALRPFAQSSGPLDGGLATLRRGVNVIFYEFFGIKKINCSSEFHCRYDVETIVVAWNQRVPDKGLAHLDRAGVSSGWGMPILRIGKNRRLCSKQEKTAWASKCSRSGTEPLRSPRLPSSSFAQEISVPEPRYDGLVSRRRFRCPRGSLATAAGALCRSTCAPAHLSRRWRL